MGRLELDFEEEYAKELNARYGPKPNPRYGLRYFVGGKEIRLAQISGGGRVLLLDTDSGKSWWSKPPRDVAWHVYEASGGQRWAWLDNAEQVKQILSLNL